MDGNHGGSGSSSPPPFLTKTYDMVDDPATDTVVSWSPANNSFVVWNPPEFARDLLPKYFKHNNFSSFVRQLNTYGFRKIDPDQWEFGNEDFVRGHRHLLTKIHRRKPIHSHSLQNSLLPLAEEERKELEDEIERLKCDKSVLMLELQKHSQQKYGMDREIQSLEERLRLMEQRQRSMVDFLSQVVHKPDFLSNLTQQADLHSKKRRLLKNDFFGHDATMEDNQIVALEGMGRDKSGCSSPLDVEPFEKMETSLNSLETFLRSVSQVSGGDLYYDDDLPCLPSTVVLTEVHTSSGETDVRMRSSSPKFHPSSPCLGDIHSSPELAESTSYGESPRLLPVEIHSDTRSKISEIDVNSEPAGAEVNSSTDGKTETATSTVAVGVNDVFWEQFLTETPGSSEAREVQSERRDADERRAGELNTGERVSVWWNRKNVDHLTEQLGHLTSAEKT